MAPYVLKEMAIHKSEKSSDNLFWFVGNNFPMDVPMGSQTLAQVWIFQKTPADFPLFLPDIHVLGHGCLQ